MQARLRLEWRAQASADLPEIVAYIADDNPDAAQELEDELVEMVNVVHARRQWPQHRQQGRTGWV